MPAKRRAAKARPQRVTPEAIDAYVVRDQLSLCRALGLKPWEMSPLDCDPSVPPTNRNSPYAASWRQAVEIRAELDAAARRNANPSTARERGHV